MHHIALQSSLDSIEQEIDQTLYRLHMLHVEREDVEDALEVQTPRHLKLSVVTVGTRKVIEVKRTAIRRIAELVSEAENRVSDRHPDEFSLTKIVPSYMLDDLDPDMVELDT